MPHLYREVSQRDDDDDPTDELAQVSERLKIQRGALRRFRLGERDLYGGRFELRVAVGPIAEWLGG